MEELEKLTALLEKGLITREQFESRRDQLMAEEQAASDQPMTNGEAEEDPAVAGDEASSNPPKESSAPGKPGLSRFFKPKRGAGIAPFLLSVVMVIWAIGIVVGSVVGPGFLLIIFCMYILSFLACCVCPCLGELGVLATTGLLATAVAWEVFIFITTLSIATVVSFAALCAAFADRDHLAKAAIVLVIHIVLLLLMVALDAFPLAMAAWAGLLG